ncbi:MAG: hypothetical protein NZX77_20270, partial [Polyangiaceae bacterium]|nr:hypothetical protein [Polyangiaceae bacterium]
MNKVRGIGMVAVWATLLMVAGYGCSSEDEGVPPTVATKDIVYAPMGSLSLVSGKGSFRFGAASAAT